MRRGLALAVAVLTATSIGLPSANTATALSESSLENYVNSDSRGMSTPAAVTTRARVNYSAVAQQVATQLSSGKYSTRLAGTSRALSLGGLPIEQDGGTIVAVATAPVGKMRVTVAERASLALYADQGALSARDLAGVLKSGKVLTRTGAPTTVLGGAMRAWINDAKSAPTDVTSFAPLLVQSGVLGRYGVDLSKGGADLSQVSFSSLEIQLFAASLDRAIPASDRKVVPSRKSHAAPAAPAGPLDPNAQACADETRLWIKQHSLALEQVTMTAAGKVIGEGVGMLLGWLNEKLNNLALPPKAALTKDFVKTASEGVGRALAVLNIIVKIQKAALLYSGTDIYVDTPAGESFAAPIEAPGVDSSGFAPFAAIVGLKATEARDYEKAATTQAGRDALDNRRYWMDCADLFGLQVPASFTSDAGEDLESFRIVWELQTNKYVQWDVGHRFIGIQNPPRTTWYTRPPHAVGALTKIDNSQAAHVMYARIPAQPDYRLRPSLYEKRTTQAVATAHLDFSQPPNVKTLTDAAMGGVDPMGLLGSLNDSLIGMFEAMNMPSADASIEIVYYAPKCSGRARAIWRGAGVCEGRTLSVGVTGEGTVTSNPEGLSCDPTCERQFSKGEVVTLAAQPAEGWRFSGWMGGTAAAAGCMEVPTCTITMDSDVSIEAAFTEIPTVRLRVTVDGHGVVQAGFTIFCGTNATLCEYPATIDGEALTLVATADSGYQFDGWSGACSGTATCDITTTEDLQEVTATFSEVPSLFRRISVAADGAQVFGHTFGGFFSPDGTKFYFSSKSSGLVSGDDNGAEDVFVKDLATGAVSRLSVGAGGVERGSTSLGTYRDAFLQAISPDGTKLLMWGPSGPSWTATDGGSLGVWLKDLVTGAVSPLVDPYPNLVDGHTGYAWTAQFGADAIYYQVYGYHCRDEYSNAVGCHRVVRRDLASGALTLVDFSAFGDERLGDGPWPYGRSADGRHVYFYPGSSSTCGCYTLTLDTSTGSISTLIVNGNQAGVESGSNGWASAGSGTLVVGGYTGLTSDTAWRGLWNPTSGQFTPYAHRADLFFDLPVLGGAYVWRYAYNPGYPGHGIQYLTNVGTGVTVAVPGVPLLGPDDTDFAVSPDGQHLVIASSQDNLVPGDTNGAQDLFMVDVSDLVALAFPTP